MSFYNNIVLHKLSVTWLCGGEDIVPYRGTVVGHGGRACWSGRRLPIGGLPVYRDSTRVIWRDLPHGF